MSPPPPPPVKKEKERQMGRVSQIRSPLQDLTFWWPAATQMGLVRPAPTKASRSTWVPLQWQGCSEKLPPSGWGALCTDILSKHTGQLKGQGWWWSWWSLLGNPHILDETHEQLPGTCSHSPHSTDGWACGVKPFICSGQGWQTFSVRGLTINILGFPAHTVSILTTRLCCHNTKAPTGSARVHCVSWLCSNKTLLRDAEIWMSHDFPGSGNSILLLIFFTHLEIMKTVLSSRTVQNWGQMGQLWPMSHSLPSRL